MINSTSEIVPHRFMPYSDGEKTFYKLPEKRIESMARTHYEGDQRGLTGFSPWAASLHLVLCYANSMRAEEKPHIAVMDTQNVGDVLVWHCQPLLGRGNEEYLAYGPIRGRGYRAVPLEDLRLFGLYTLCPELRGAYRQDAGFQFGVQWREKIFQDAPTAITDGQVKLAERIAICFGSLCPPVLMALLCLEPRLQFDPATGIRTTGDIARRLRKTIEQAAPSQYLMNLKTKQESWYFKGVVDTKDFPDVRQWITLFRTVVLNRNPGQTVARPPQPKVRSRDHVT